MNERKPDLLDLYSPILILATILMIVMAIYYWVV